MLKSKILFVMTGSIACYKACHAISRLNQADCEIQVVASEAALKFVGAATLEGLTGRPVISDMYAAGNVMDHIHLMRWADLVVVAPATANFLNKSAQGLGDDLISTLFLAHDFKRPLLIAPAMNSSMFTHPLTQRSIQTLKDLGIEVLKTDTGSLACGEEGLGRLIDPDILVQKILSTIQHHKGNTATNFEKASEFNLQNKLPQSLQAKIKILVTAGGTQEPIDTVRVVSNLSSGRTGISIAESLTHMGFDVTLVQSHASTKSTEVQHREVFTSFASLDQTLNHLLANNDYTHIIHTAAVSDYSVESLEVKGAFYKPFEVKKVSSDTDTMSIHLRRNHKIVDRLKSYSKNKNLKVIAFKLTSHASSDQKLDAILKLFAHSNADFIVHNDLTDIDIVKKTHAFSLNSLSGKDSDNSLSQRINTIPCENLNLLTQQLIQILISDMETPEKNNLKDQL